MDHGLRWAAALALVLLALGAIALAVSDPYEGPLVLTLGSRHAVRLLDALGVALLATATALTWMIGLIWQHRHAGNLLSRGTKRAAR